MEQSVKKRQIMILAAGGLVTRALVAAHYLSPISRRLAANEDVELVLLNKDRPMLFVYHSFSRTLNAVRLPARAARSGSAYQRACEILKLFPKGGEAAQAEPAYIEVSAAGGPDMGAFEDLVNTWRARPARLAGAVRYLSALKKSEATNLSVHELVLLALELSRLNSSNFIKEDFDKTRPPFQGIEPRVDTAIAVSPTPPEANIKAAENGFPAAAPETVTRLPARTSLSEGRYGQLRAGSPV